MPWDWLEQSDLWVQGPPEYTRYVSGTLRRSPEMHLGLNIVGQYVPHLGLLAIRCERKGDTVTPISVAIAETTVIDHESDVDGTVGML